MFTICLHFGHTLFTSDLYNVLKDKGKGYSKRVSKVYVFDNKTHNFIGCIYITKTGQEFWLA
jgi:hypothetical protein|nr:MAG TPA: hypothetical protein [Caudoviricetes sp.]